mmetsp:Transcript_25247/g.37279  ORF Transcript_25247/g.37279 Transcript_25247/m.37279 type:complete len:104 (+) Transcript_25247:144-455(+)|eukprot:CAMPEP_0194199172 /NCGR_PEP_ID=MMETSP0156-20130528/287_1 /TAXON_ID=33649 /ORGANISM="Thalassionema nitzschioides, Strain L26-B" /LENGTH=103 /DNA_ID=CAMNT_0038924027 /DNA_START=123 /DNA_END=434 /DNA_ORIENTATION=-
MFRTRALLRTIAPLGDRVLVRRAAKETQTAGGIIIPADNAKDPNEGEVVAVGAGERDMNGTLHAVSLLVGDKVLLPPYGGTEVKIEDDEMFLFRETEILGKFE